LLRLAWRGVLAAALLLGLGLAAQAAAAEVPKPGKRIALVIGIDAYQNAPHLTNPIKDAHAVGAALRALNFDVTELLDPDVRRMSEGIREFGIASQDAEAALVYYAGHGVQVDHENYLLPADARLERERDLLYEGLPLSLVLGEVSQASRIGIVLLDSCRNNPFVERMSRAMRQSGRPGGVALGLARVDSVPRNTLVAMATRADEVAQDGIDHSPFAVALIKELAVPGVELSLFFRSVHDSVLAATKNNQEPYIFSALGAEPFFFHPRPPSRPPQIAAVTPLTVRENAGPTPLGLPRPSDPDGNPLSVRIIGLPRVGEVRVAGRPIAPNETFPLDQFMTATYTADGQSLGPVGSLDILVEDGVGGSVAANLPISVVPSHHPAVVEGPRTVRVHPQGLGIVPPTSPDGDPLTVVVRALPSGIVRNGATVLRVGDRLNPNDLGNLTFMPEPGFAGSAGILLYAVDNGRGDTVEGRVDIEVATAADPTEPVSAGALWERLRMAGRATEIEAFLRLFPASRFAAEARARLAALEAEQPPPPAAAPPVAAAPAAPPSGEAGKTTLALAAPAASPPPATPAEASRVIAPIPAPPPAVGGGTGAGEFRDCPTCPVMVPIPAGTFIMGQGSRDAEAAPAHRVAVRAFAIGRYPVTIGEWKACLAGGGCKALPRLATADERAPMHNISWDEAAQFAAWLARSTGQKYRLPSEAEWEYAARGGSPARYWWGEAFGAVPANCADCGGAQNPRAPLAVDQYKPNPFGLVDVLGGVEEWVADCWVPNYHGAPADAKPREVKACEQRVLRGGSFRSNHDDITVASRNSYDQSVRYPLNGMRIARDLE
jgi:formylglycine-generating enzyme required for sulfatase activity